MQRRPLLVGALVILAGAALILFWVMRGASPVPETASPSATTTSTASPSQTPTGSPGATPGATAEPPPSAAVEHSGLSLQIPEIGLQEALHSEGLRDGRINPPAGTVMWYTGHDRVPPGQVGTSVIAGHVGAYGSPDRFADLSDVAVGDEVEIVTRDGERTTFTVVRAEVVDKDELTTDNAVWGNNSSVRRLAIITCDDAFGYRGDGHRVANYVVIAEAA